MKELSNITVSLDKGEYNGISNKFNSEIFYI